MPRLSLRPWHLGLIGILLVLPLSAVAAGEFSAQDGIMTMLATIVTFAMSVINVLMWVLFILLDILMDPAIIFGNVGGPDGALLTLLHEIWMFTRDIVNIIFAVLLIVGAVYTIVTANFEKAKTLMPTFVITVVAVNLSWFVPRVIYDVSQLTAYTVFQLPSALNRPQCKTRSLSGQLKDCEIVQAVLFFQDTNLVRDDQQQGGGVWKCPLRPLVCVNWVPITKARGLSSRTWILNGLIINHARLITLANVPQTEPFVGTGSGGGGLAELGRLLLFVVKLMLVFMLHLALFFPLLAMVVVFFMRIPYLWFTMAFMPVVTLHFLLPAGIFKEFDPWEKVWKQFLNAAFLPTVVAVPFSVGYIMLNAGMELPEPVGGYLGTRIPLLVGVTTVWQLLWLVMALVVLWVGVFAALKSAKIAESVVGAIEGMGKAAAKWPLAAPIIPIPKPGGGMAKASILGMKERLDPSRRLAEKLAAERSQFHGGPQRDQVDSAKRAITNNASVNQHINAHISTQLRGNRLNEIRREDLDRIVRDVRAHAPGASDDAILHAIAEHVGITDESLKSRFIDDARIKLRAAGTPPAQPPAAPQNI